MADLLGHTAHQPLEASTVVHLGRRVAEQVRPGGGGHWSDQRTVQVRREGGQSRRPVRRARGRRPTPSCRRPGRATPGRRAPAVGPGRRRRPGARPGSARVAAAQPVGVDGESAHGVGQRRRESQDAPRGRATEPISSESLAAAGPRISSSAVRVQTGRVPHREGRGGRRPVPLRRAARRTPCRRAARFDRVSTIRPASIRSATAESISWGLGGSALIAGASRHRPTRSAPGAPAYTATAVSTARRTSACCGGSSGAESRLDKVGQDVRGVGDGVAAGRLRRLDRPRARSAGSGCRVRRRGGGTAHTRSRDSVPGRRPTVTGQLAGC